MRKIIILLLLISFYHAGAQTYLTGGIGIMNYNGDIQKPGITFNQARPTITLGANFLIDDHFSVTGSLTQGWIGADDAKSKWPRRNLSFKSNVFDIAFTVEYDLFDLNHTDFENINYVGSGGPTRITPYAFAGIGLFHFNPYTFDSSGEKHFLQPLGTEGQGLAQYPDRDFYKLWQINIPFGLGVKYAVSDRLLLSAEFGYRKAFTDYMDDISSYDYADTTILREARGAKTAELSIRAYELKNSDYNMEDEYRGNPTKNDNFYTCLIKINFLLKGEGLFNR